ncbi:glycerate kinase [Nitratidesulfovibrio sp. SRB-5]|uniref:glycerate kinase type-2 family protein n=1 Tax=Nitratidesulfovibrio sp. SRB-5 TaxID=2872636 RepID=UPI0010260153|nr:DUF4147 domain-containing protein [Nitratidesulfovibrio sp. SRB-5]MBZ2170973.1 DUF4147 domain-containing protein [Nitratidesulfovibrio sp. SRB-5]RXF74856.1 DUF4147 domain-containing protein [Desulfovibrio sp. DS-1]
MTPEQRAVLDHILSRALDAVAPDRAVHRHVRRNGNILHIAGRDYDLSAHERVYVVGAGKGAAPMAAALEDILGDRVHDGVVVVKYGHTAPLKRIALREAAHPVPDAAGERAANEILDLVRTAGPRDLVLCALTGGASALTPALQPGITLDDMRAATTLLLECGATIHEINALRKHLSAFGGGNLARAAAPARVVSLIISDVVGDDLDVIASGPTSPDVSTYADCKSIADRFGILHRLPGPVVERLTAGLRGMAAETPKPGDPVFGAVQNCIVASNRLALEAAAEAAAAHGYRPRILTDTMTGEARVRARELVEEAASAAEGLPHPEGPFCLLAGGETTVTITGGGLGGRNQEMALAAAIRMDELADCQHIAMLCAGTDGTDGPTDAAGGYASGSTLCVARQCGVDAHGHLADNDAYHFLDRTGHLLRTGPTLTNVMDLAVLLVDAPKGKPAA